MYYEGEKEVWKTFRLQKLHICLKVITEKVLRLLICAFVNYDQEHKQYWQLPRFFYCDLFTALSVPHYLYSIC